MEIPATASSSNSVASSLDGRSSVASGGNAGSDFLNLSMFGRPSAAGVGDLLLGATSSIQLGSNGYANDSTAAAAVAAQNTGSASFDINDFPSLGGAGPSGASSANSLAAALRQQQQQQILAQQQILGSKTAAVTTPASSNTNSVTSTATATTTTSGSSNMYRLAMQGAANFNMATEDFPALPTGGAGSNGSSLLLGGANGGQTISTITSATAFGSLSRRPSGGATSSSGVGGLHGTGELGNDASNPLNAAGSLLGGSGLIGGLGGMQQQAGSSLNGIQQQQQQKQQHQKQQQSQRSTSNAAPPSSSSSPAAAAGSALSGDFGLLGLLSVIRMTDADRNALALGTDLTSLGLSLNKSENLYANFVSPFSDSQATKEPHYQLPMCYYMQPPALKTGHLSKFQLETLFYIFYAMPKDVLQAYAAQELYAREWRYHGELKRWFQRDQQAGFVYFDQNTWERRLLNNGGSTSTNLQSISNGFLSDDDVRVKFPSA